MKRLLGALCCNNNIKSVGKSVAKEKLAIGVLVIVVASFLLLPAITNYIAISTITNPTVTILPIQSALAISTSSLDSSSSSNVKIDVISLHQVHGVAGQFIKFEGTITNLSPNQSVNGGIAYISLVDLKDKVPVDLEDWSAQKGLYIPFIAPGQSLPLEWNVRLVKAGSYTLDMLFNRDGDFSSPPAASSKIFLNVAPKLNLNPGNVLPVAFGVPAVLMAALGLVNYIRGRKMGIYK